MMAPAVDAGQRAVIAEIVEVLADGLRRTSKRLARSSTITRPKARAMLRISFWRWVSPVTAAPRGWDAAMVRPFRHPVNAPVRRQGRADG